MRGAAILLGTALVLAAAQASAQTPAPPAPSSPSTTVEGITIVAPKVEQEKLPALIDRFVDAHSATSRIDQLSRWGGPACPQVGGLTPAFDAFVAQRIKAVAASVGAPSEKRPNRNFPCKVNILVVFTDQPQALLDDTRRRHPQMLGFHYAAQAERLARVEHPIQGWYMTGTGPRGGFIEPDNEFHRLPSGAAKGRLSAGLESQILAVLVVVDANKVVGHQIGAIADDVAMLSLAHASLVKGGCSALPTILDFLNPDCPATSDPSGLTAYDVAYLKGLYSVDPEEFAKAQRSEIGSRILRDVGNAPVTP